MIEADFGVIDSRIESKLQSIKDLISSIKQEEPLQKDKEKKEKNIVEELSVEESSEKDNSNDDLFKDSNDILSLGDSFDDDSFDFLTDDDE